VGRRAALLPLIVLAVVLGGCFGGATHYTAKKSTPCLKKHFKLFPLSTAKAQSLGLEALLGLDSPGHYVAFYKDEKTAKQRRIDFVHRAAQSGAAGSDTVEQKGNVVLILASEDRTQDSTVLNCLK
jgi:hypothetical protein